LFAGVIFDKNCHYRRWEPRFFEEPDHGLPVLPRIQRFHDFPDGHQPRSPRHDDGVRQEARQAAQIGDKSGVDHRPPNRPRRG